MPGALASAITVTPAWPALQGMISTWISSSILRLTVIAVNSSAPAPNLSNVTVQVTTAALPLAIRNADATSSPVSVNITAASIYGGFGTFGCVDRSIKYFCSPLVVVKHTAPPRFSEVRAMSNWRLTFGAGNQLRFRFDLRVTQVPVATKADLDNLLNCTLPYGMGVCID